jgi:hypothetical protein
MEEQATSAHPAVTHAKPVREPSSACAPLSEDSVYESLVAYGAPLANWAPRLHLRLEEVLPWALRLARGNATVLRVLPLVLARHATELDWELLEDRARAVGQEAELGFLLELTAELTARDELAHRAERFVDARPEQPRYFFEPRGERDRKLAELRTPLVARRWGLLLNMPEESFSSLLARHDAPLQR